MNTTWEHGKASEVVLECLNTTPDASEDEAEAATRPSLASQLIGDWNMAVAEVSSESANSKNYYECMDSADIKVLDETGLPSTELAQAYTALGPNSQDIPSSPEDQLAQSAGWKTFLENEKEIIDADWSCRERVYNAHIMDLAPVITDFATQHASEIRQVQGQWSLIEADAKRVGFTGQTGALGG